MNFLVINTTLLSVVLSFRQGHGVSPILVRAALGPRYWSPFPGGCELLHRHKRLPARLYEEPSISKHCLLYPDRFHDRALFLTGPLELYLRSKIQRRKLEAGCEGLANHWDELVASRTLVGVQSKLL